MSSHSPSRRLRAAAVPVLATALAFSLPGIAAAHEFDHPAPAAPGENAPFEYLMAGSDFYDEGVEFEALTSIPTGNPHSDIEFFTSGGETYASVGTLAAGTNRGGQTIIKLTEGGQVETEDGLAPVYAAGHPSATCVSDPSAALGLQHDVEATPKGDTISNDSYLPELTEDAQLLIDATDGRGRCHDQGRLGLSAAPLGGLEIIDVTGLGEEGFQPAEIALTSHVGQSHTVNIDPKRPHIAYSVTSDGVNVAVDNKGTPDTADDTYVRRNEPLMTPNANTGAMEPNPQRNNLDGFEVVDLSSCMYKTEAVPAGTLDPAIQDLPLEEQLDAKREACKPEVYRYRYDSLAISQGHTIKTGVFGCHELKPYPDDKLTCGSGAAAMVFDMSGAFDAAGKPQGEPLACSLRPSSSVSNGTGALITDCTVDTKGTPETTDDVSLSIPQWLKDGAPSLTGVKHLGSVHHIGRAAAQGFATTIPATEDIDFNHETEFTRSGRFLLATDERGGGVTGGAQCTEGESNPQVNGGVHAYRVDQLLVEEPAAPREPETPERGTTATRDDADAAYAQSYTGEEDDPETADVDESLGKAIYRAETRTGAEGTFCTAHVLQQVPDQTRIFMGWYTQGTQVLDYVELPGSKLQFVETGYAIPAGAVGGPKSNTWVSHVFQSIENEDGSFTYYGATGDITRLAIDVFKVTMPAPLTVCDLKNGTAERSEPSTVADRDQAREVHRENVDCVLDYKISSGKTVDAQGVATSYAALEDVTRGQMARFVANALDASGAGSTAPVVSGADAFPDIANNTHREAINRLEAAGIVRGDASGRFNPDALITRAQMATFIVEAARVASGRSLAPESLTSFGDVPASSTHARNINAGFEAGLFRGTVAPAEGKPGSFAPAVNVKRDQMATFLVELFTQSIR